MREVNCKTEKLGTKMRRCLKKVEILKQKITFLVCIRKLMHNLSKQWIFTPMNRQGNNVGMMRLKVRHPLRSQPPTCRKRSTSKRERHKTCCLRFANRFSDFLDVNDSKQIDNLREEILLREFKQIHVWLRRSILPDPMWKRALSSVKSLFPISFNVTLKYFIT